MALVAVRLAVGPAHWPVVFRAYVLLFFFFQSSSFFFAWAVLVPNVFAFCKASVGVRDAVDAADLLEFSGALEAFALLAFSLL